VLVAAIADTHVPRGSRRLPEACAERLRAADLVIHAGDLVSRAFLDELRALGPPVHAVAGNVDEPALRALLPERLVVGAGEASIGVVHDGGRAAGREARLAAAFPGCNAVIYGHSHMPNVSTHAGVWILNPGSPTERRRAPTRTMLELRIVGKALAPELIDLP